MVCTLIDRNPLPQWSRGTQGLPTIRSLQSPRRSLPPSQTPRHRMECSVAACKRRPTSACVCVRESVCLCLLMSAVCLFSCLGVCVRVWASVCLCVSEGLAASLLRKKTWSTGRKRRRALASSPRKPDRISVRLGRINSTPTHSSWQHSE